MKLFKNLLIAGLAFTSLSAGAQTADEIIAKNTEAMGGATKLATLTSVKMNGNMTAQGMDIPLTITKSHMKGMRVDIDIMGTSNYQIITTDKGYMFFPIQQMTEPKELDADMVSAAQSQLDLQGSLVNYKEKGVAVEFIGKEKIDGADVYKLKVTGKAGRDAMYFIDANTNRLVKTSGKAKGPDGTEMDVETTYGDYKQNADGFWFAYTTTTMNGPITFDKIETNVKVDESIFKN
ncbi:MAG: hypothetical protein WKF88_06035 [Ferruginibacter sp.]